MDFPLHLFLQILSQLRTITVVIIAANLAAGLTTDDGVPPLSLVLASAAADVIGVTVGVAVADGKAVREARKALGHTVDVASDTLLQAWHFDFAATDGDVASGRVLKVDLVRRLDGLFGSWWEGEVTSSTPSVYS